MFLKKDEQIVALKTEDSNSLVVDNIEECSDAVFAGFEDTIARFQAFAC